MPKVNAEQFADKWQRRMKASSQDIRDGISRVTEAPTAKAAAKKDKMLNNLTAAVQSGKWEEGLKRVSLQDWKNAALNKGLARINAGVDGAGDKVKKFAGELLNYESGLQDEIANMPDLTLEDSIARMTAWTRGMANFKRG